MKHATAEEGRAANGKPRRITRSMYQLMLAAYKERPTIGHVREAGVGWKMAKRAITTGWPEYNLPPLAEVVQREQQVLDDQHQVGVSGESSSSPATEGDAVDLAMSSAIALAKSMYKYSSQMLERLDQEAVEREALNPKAVAQLVRAIAGSSSLLKEAVALQRTRQEAPRSTYWAQLGGLLDACNDRELVTVAESGELPERLIYASPASTARLLAMVSSDEPEPDGTRDMAEATPPGVAESGSTC